MEEKTTTSPRSGSSTPKAGFELAEAIKDLGEKPKSQREAKMKSPVLNPGIIDPLGTKNGERTRDLKSQATIVEKKTIFTKVQIRLSHNWKFIIGP